MLDTIKNTLKSAATVAGDIATNFFDYDAAAYGTAAVVVLAVGVCGLTPITLAAIFVAPVAAGLYNFYFNSGIGQI